jgi:hypothetical protein
VRFVSPEEDSLPPAMDQPPPEPYVRHDDDTNTDWHIAVRVLPDGKVVIRCRIVPLTAPLDWRLAPPEISIDENACPRCLRL